MTLVIRIANYPYRLDSSGKNFITVILLYVLWLKFSPICKIRVNNYVLMFYL
jgi:hypothetical protein